MLTTTTIMILIGKVVISLALVYFLCNMSFRAGVSVGVKGSFEKIDEVLKSAIEEAQAEKKKKKIKNQED
jgi:hypothetical protein